MNFFEHQDRAQRRTRWLLLLFGLAVLAIVVVVNVIVLVVFGQTEQVPRGEPWLTPGLLADNTALIIWTTLLTAGLIGLGSLYRTVGLRDGGGTVARELGGTRVDGDVQDPLRRRLRNVVEEIAIASGVPVPEIYVLEQELGINAFAAGYSPDDAAIAVTRGALERLDREELQGVVAHEFGHVLNGDMRLNIRLMGLLFGILVLALVGQRIMLAMRFSRNNRNAGGLVAAGLALVVAGYVGLFFARWIRASVSRQREYLADASAVQFTRHPEGIAGALKKIGAARQVCRQIPRRSGTCCSRAVRWDGYSRPIRLWRSESRRSSRVSRHRNWRRSASACATRLGRVAPNRRLRPRLGRRSRAGALVGRC